MCDAASDGGAHCLTLPLSPAGEEAALPLRSCASGAAALLFYSPLAIASVLTVAYAFQDAVLPAMAVLEAAAAAPLDTSSPEASRAEGIASSPEAVRAAAGVFEALVSADGGSPVWPLAHATARVLWQQRAFAVALQPLLQVRHTSDHNLMCLRDYGSG